MASKDCLRTREKSPLHPKSMLREKSCQGYEVVWEPAAADRSSGKCEFTRLKCKLKGGHLRCIQNNMSNFCLLPAFRRCLDVESVIHRHCAQGQTIGFEERQFGPFLLFSRPPGDGAGKAESSTGPEESCLPKCNVQHVDSIVSSPLLSYFNLTAPSASSAAPDTPPPFQTLSDPS